MGHFGIIKFYLKGVDETILAYVKARLLLASQKNLVSGSNGSLILTLVNIFGDKVAC